MKNAGRKILWAGPSSPGPPSRPMVNSPAGMSTMPACLPSAALAIVADRTRVPASTSDPAMEKRLGTITVTSSVVAVGERGNAS